MLEMGGATPITGICEMHVRIGMATPKSWPKAKVAQNLGRPCTDRSDADNHLKQIADALSGVAYLDDRQIAHMSITRHWSSEDRIAVDVREIVW